MKTFAFAAMLALSGAAFAHEGHDHADAAPPPLPESAAPRVEAASPQFELVAVAESRGLVIWVDRYADNAPVDKAQVEVDAGGRSVPAQAQPDGSYLAALRFDTPGNFPLVFAVTAPDGDDLLPATLVVEKAADAVVATQAEAPVWRAALPWVAGIGLGTVALGWGVRRRHGGVQ